VLEWNFYFKLKSASEIEEELGMMEGKLFTDADKARATRILTRHLQVRHSASMRVMAFTSVCCARSDELLSVSHIHVVPSSGCTGDEQTSTEKLLIGLHSSHQTSGNVVLQD
jgi:hypothetical protein